MGLGVFYGQRVGLMIWLAPVVLAGQSSLWQMCDQFTGKFRLYP